MLLSCHQTSPMALWRLCRENNLYSRWGISIGMFDYHRVNIRFVGVNNFEPDHPISYVHPIYPYHTHTPVSHLKTKNRFDDNLGSHSWKPLNVGLDYFVGVGPVDHSSTGVWTELHTPSTDWFLSKELLCQLQVFLPWLVLWSFLTVRRSYGNDSKTS